MAQRFLVWSVRSILNFLLIRHGIPHETTKQWREERQIGTGSELEAKGITKVAKLVADFKDPLRKCMFSDLPAELSDGSKGGSVKGGTVPTDPTEKFH